MHALLELCKLLSPDATLLSEVQLAIEHPDQYQKLHGVRLARRGVVVKSPPSLSWLALIDGLSERRQLVELAWNEEPGTVQTSIDELLAAGNNKPMDWSWAGDEELEQWWDRETDEFLTAIARQLAERSLSLLEMQVDGDTYPLMIVKESQLPQLLEASRRCEIGGIQPLA